MFANCILCINIYSVLFVQNFKVQAAINVSIATSSVGVQIDITTAKTPNKDVIHKIHANENKEKGKVKRERLYIIYKKKKKKKKITSDPAM